jgi:hypothetical protein
MVNGDIIHNVAPEKWATLPQHRSAMFCGEYKSPTAPIPKDQCPGWVCGESFHLRIFNLSQGATPTWPKCDVANFLRNKLAQVTHSNGCKARIALTASLTEDSLPLRARFPARDLRERGLNPRLPPQL